MAYKEYTAYGKCRNCGKEVLITSIPEIYLGYSGVTADEMLLSLVNGGTLSRIHECEEGKLGIIEPTYFKEE